MPLTQTFGILSRNQVHVCAICSSNRGNSGLQPNSSRALLESLTRIGGSPGPRGQISTGTGCAVTFAAVLITSATENQRPLPRLKEVLDRPAANDSMARHGRRRGR